MSDTVRTRTGVRDAHQWGLWLSGLFGSRYDGLTHFAVVAPGTLLRSGQPRVRDLEQIRAEHGLQTVVAARGGTRHPLRGRWFRRERAWCAQVGVEFVHMPFSDSATPPAMVFDQFVELVRKPERCPVLVHCEQGFHRTGVLCAAYRVAVCGWSLAEAEAEMARHGFEMTRDKRQPLLEAFAAWSQQRT